MLAGLEQGWTVLFGINGFYTGFNVLLLSQMVPILFQHK